MLRSSLSVSSLSVSENPTVSENRFPDWSHTLSYLRTVSCMGAFCFALLGGSVAHCQDLPLRTRVAPKKCLAYFSWAGTENFDPTGSPTEKWMAQPAIVAAFNKAKTEVLDYARFEVNSENDKVSSTGFDVFSQLSVMALDRPGCYYITDVSSPMAKVKIFDSALVFKLGAQAKDIKKQFDLFYQSVDEKMKAEEAKIVAGKKTADEEESEEEEPMEDAEHLHPMFRLTGVSYPKAETVTIDKIQYKAVRSPYDGVKFYWSIRDDYLFAGTSKKSIEQLHRNMKSQAPDWLVSLRKRYSVKRITSVSYLNAQSLCEKMAVDTPEASTFFENAGFHNLKQLASVTGRNENGAITRGGLIFKGEPTGIFDVLAKKHSLTSDDFANIDTKSEAFLTAGLDLSKCLTLIEDSYILWYGLKESIDRFFDETDIDLREMVKTVGPKTTISGSLTLPDPSKGFVLDLEISDEAAYQKPFKELMTYLELIAEDEDNDVTFNNKTKAEQTFYSYKNRWQSGHWVTRENGVAMAFNKRRLQKYTRPPGKPQTPISRIPISQAPGIKLLLDPSKTGFKGQLIAAGRVNYYRWIKMLIPLAKSFIDEKQTLGSSKLTIKDLPPTATIVSALQPLVIGIYRNENGFSFYGQHTLPAFTPNHIPGMIAGFTIPASIASSREYRKNSSQSGMRYVLQACHSFHREYESFPALYSTDEEGKPLLSWRVHLLPFMDEEELYDEFHLDEPWDSKHNSTLIHRMPWYYDSSDFGGSDGKTGYLAVTGKDAGFGKPQEDGWDVPMGIKLEDIKDGPSKTAILVQVKKGHLVTWTAPQDFDFSKKDSSNKLENHGEGVTIGFADQSARTIDIKTKWDLLLKMFTRSGGESVTLGSKK